MEDKKLNFEKPLISARRFSQESGSKWKIEDSVRSVRRPPQYKSELKSGPVSNPGTVPFEWEQIPGRPKDDETRLETDVVAESYKVPNLPPGRTLRVGKEDFDKDHESSSILSLDENVKQTGSFRSLKEEMENFSSENEDEEFVDALETLSRAESLLINCSLSGLSGLDYPSKKGSGISAIDSQTRDIMMGRFLPAAKAMASETPQHASKKPPVVRQQLSQPRKMVNEDKRPQLRYGPDFALEYLNRRGNDEESDEDFDEGENFQGKICGMLPGLGFRNSLCLLNPLPGMSMRSRAPVPRRKSQSRTSSWSCSETDRKVSFYKVGLPSFRELTGEDNRSKKKNVGSPLGEKTLYVDTEHEVRSLHIKSFSSDVNEQTEPEVKKHAILVEKRDQNQILDSSPVNTETLNLMEKGAKSEIKFQIPDFSIASSRGEVDQKNRTGTRTTFSQVEDISKGSKMLSNEPRKSESKIYPVMVPPPLPKAPSDSWLGRTLSSISTKNTSVHSYQGRSITPKDQASKLKSSDPKWETMVRMTMMQDKQLCFSEDRLTPIPEA